MNSVKLLWPFLQIHLGTAGHTELFLGAQFLRFIKFQFEFPILKKRCSIHTHFLSLRLKVK